MSLENVVALLRNEEGIAQAVAVLKQRFGERAQTGQAIREQHGHTTTYVPTQAPDIVIFAHNTQDVQDVVRICAEYKVPVIAFGAGSSLEGQVNAPAGGVSIDLTQMNRVLAVHAEDLDCVIEPGITRRELNEYLRDTGLFFPIDPGANATLGGMASTRASGTNAVRYGTMRENVLALKAVMPDGRLIETSKRVKKTAAGYDLTRLLIGSEGTLGIITELTLKLQGIPQAVSGGICPFPDIESACRAVIETIQMGIPVARIELVNKLQMEALILHSKLPYEAQPYLFVEFHGTETGVAEQAEIFGEIATENGGGEFRWTNDPEERDRLWRARHDAYLASFLLRPGAKGVSTDVCVPISRLADCISETEKDLAETGLIAPVVGHVGDGNFHLLLLLNTDDASEMARAEDFMDRLVRRALAMEGTCTGEHGIGQGKMKYLSMELGEATDFMGMVKKALDPNNIMNPGKILIS
ncbi:FAD-binding oxidoreductase [Brucella thiophenivorans]|uniref:D-lactate dehydrogenase (cytochrome) n=1 Tax=Brucella thiophenivorans TaxID=571255 RepID=A0A256G5H6_9HYPH|nr:FAD-linked oxidase C-terminal domain-containing protein [Brucella thiophenivorans]OYR22367.1 FAD linked oxidase, C-terminal domain protein [Brucella thiophenivorans]